MADAAALPSAGTTVLHSGISQIASDGLRYRGIAIEEIVAGAGYEEVAWLLWTGAAPTAVEHAALLTDIDAGANLPEGIWRASAALPPETPPVARLQVLLPLLALLVPELAEDSAAPPLQRAARLLGAFATLAGNAQRGVRPQSAVSHRGVAATFLGLARGNEPSDSDVRAFEQVLILYADHELNASTFAGRVAASTRADLVSAVLAALCTLRGPLHGGVDRHVRALIAAAEQEGPALVIDRYLRAGMPLPGFGHAVYTGVDPRAVLMHELARRLAPAAGQVKLLEVMEATEAEATRRGAPPMNVDLYTVAVYRSLGVPDVLSTLVFATARLAGWTAHILEQYADNRLIRPRAAYTGFGPRRWPPTEPSAR